MDWLEAVLLGLIQGITEFLPISSSGHLEIMRVLLGIDGGQDSGLLLMIALHGATALATVVYFRRDIGEICSAAFRSDPKSWWFIASIAISMLPAVVVGLGFEAELSALFGGRTDFIGMMLLVTAGLLTLPSILPSGEAEVGLGRGFLIGVAQALAILPGISRSGATISAALMLGIDRAKAARFSFLMVIPLILGKIGHLCVTTPEVVQGALTGQMCISIVVAFVSALVACHWMLAIVRSAKLHYFSIYCMIIGLCLLLY